MTQQIRTERPWTQQFALRGREKEIQNLVNQGYSAAQIIRLLRLSNPKRLGKDGRALPISRTWLLAWISRNGMRPAPAGVETQVSRAPSSSAADQRARAVEQGGLSARSVTSPASHAQSAGQSSSDNEAQARSLLKTQFHKIF